MPAFAVPNLHMKREGALKAELCLFFLLYWERRVIFTAGALFEVLYTVNKPFLRCVSSEKKIPKLLKAVKMHGVKCSNILCVIENLPRWIEGGTDIVFYCHKRSLFDVDHETRSEVSREFNFKLRDFYVNVYLYHIYIYIICNGCPLDTRVGKVLDP